VLIQSDFFNHLFSWRRKMNITKLGIIATTMGVALAGCGGGGGGGTANVITPFTSYSAVTFPSTIRMDGASQESTYTYNIGAMQVTGVSAASTYATGGSITATINAAGQTTALSMVSALGTTISLNAANGDLIGIAIPGTAIGAAVSANGQNQILSVNRLALATPWNYQNFGIWTTGAGTGSGTVGVMTAGAPTSNAGIPLTGIFTFLGAAGGMYVDPLGLDYIVGSDMSATVDFAARSVSFATANSQTTRDLIVVNLNPNLDMTGTLNYAPATNQFTGAVTTAGGGAGNIPMTGTASGRFYGPTATEIGGTFALSAAGTAAYLGAFGGIR